MADVDGYPTVCCVCDKRVLKTGTEAIVYLTVVATGLRTSRHARCVPKPRNDTASVPGSGASAPATEEGIL